MPARGINRRWEVAMIEAVIRWSIDNRFFVLLATAILVGMGEKAMINDA